MFTGRGTTRSFWGLCERRAELLEAKPRLMPQPGWEFQTSVSELPRRGFACCERPQTCASPTPPSVLFVPLSGGSGLALGLTQWSWTRSPVLGPCVPLRVCLPFHTELFSPRHLSPSPQLWRGTGLFTLTKRARAQRALQLPGDGMGKG